MDKTQLDEYLRRVNSKSNSQSKLLSLVKKEGSINNVDYYIESMKKYYDGNNLSEDGVYVVKIVV